MRDDGPRLLVDWDDGFSNFRARGPAVALAGDSTGRDLHLLVDWDDAFANYSLRRAPAAPIELAPGPAPLGLLVEWEDELSESRRRETIMAAVIAHLVFALFLVYHRDLIPEKQLSPEEQEAAIRQQLTQLYLPSDLLKLPEKAPPLTPEERKRAVVRSPLKVDPKELERILPQPAPGIPGPPGAPVLPAPEVGAGSPSGGERGEGESPKQLARLEDVPRPPRVPDAGLALPQASPGRALEEQLRRARPGIPGGQSGEGGQIQPNLNTPFPTILSDTRGVDFTPYLIRLIREVKRNWYATIPESVRFGEQGRVVIVFTIHKDGSVPPGQPAITRTSGRSHLDRPAVAAIRASQPFPPLPAEFSGDEIVLQFTFLYNLPIDYNGP
jgi:TonB family protein